MLDPLISATDLIEGASIVFTTPEKWDSLTRRWKDKQALIGSVSLLIIDEVRDINKIIVYGVKH